MLHGCRPDLILNCLVNSKKDRNLYLYLTFYLVVFNEQIFNHVAI